ncbi:MAG: TetR/AcrR family transcriptional regulator [Verrucomicrobiales bacterium]
MARSKQNRTAAPPPSTRERLLDCALTLFTEKGYSATGTQEIIDAAGVTKPVLYHYFLSKKALFCEIVSAIYDATAAAWKEVITQETTAVARLRGIARISFEGSASDPRLPRILIQTHYGPPVAELREFMEIHTARRFQCVVEIVTAGLNDGELRGGDPTSLALLFCCILDQHINVLARLPDPATFLTAERAVALVDAFLHGCGTGRLSAFDIPKMS